MSERRARPHVVVVGAGIVGASIAWQLAQSGRKVTLVEAEAEAGRGVTGRAFGWINLIHGDHSNRRAHDLQRRAVAAHEALAARLPAAYAGMRRGSLLWLGSPAETAALIDRKAAAGADVRPAETAEIERLEPRLRDAPALAAFSPSDMAVDAAGLSRALADGAEALGAVFRRGDTVRSIRLAGDKVTGVETEAGRLEANCVVIAAGPGTASLLEPLGIDIALEISPVRLLRLACDDRFIFHIVDEPELEIRQASDGTLLLPRPAAESEAESVDRSLAAIVARFDVSAPIRVIGSSIGRRPIFADGLPRIGFVDGFEGLALAAGHPGVILAPLMGAMIADAVEAAFG